MRNLFLCVVTAVTVAIGTALVALILSVRADVVELPRLAVESRGLLLAELQATRQELLAEVDRQASGIRQDALRQVNALRVDTTDVVTRIADTINQRSGEALRVADSRLSGAQVASRSADGIAADVRREADEITRPKKWWQKALGPVYTVGRLVGAFL